MFCGGPFRHYTSNPLFFCFITLHTYPMEIMLLKHAVPNAHANICTHAHTHTSLLSASSAAVRLLLAAILSHSPSSHPPSPAPPCTALCSLTPPSGACRAASRTGTGGLRWSRQRVSRKTGTARKKALKTKLLFFYKQLSGQGERDKQPSGVQEAEMTNRH